MSENKDIKNVKKNNEKENLGTGKGGTLTVYTIIYIILAILAVLCILPFLNVFVNATRESFEIQKQGFTLIPSTYLDDNWDKLKVYADVLKGFTNSLIIAVSVTALSAYFSALTAYGFRLYKFALNKALFTFIIVMLMVPVQLGFIGMYKFMSNIGLIDTFAALIIPAIASAGTVFFLKQYSEVVIVKEIIEAARIDGSNEIFTFHRIGLPMMMPGIATMSIMTFIGSWNNYLGARVLINSTDKYTLPLMIANLKASEAWYKHQGSLYVGLAFSIIPILIVFVAFSKYIISSIGDGAVKG